MYEIGFACLVFMLNDVFRRNFFFRKRLSYD